MAIDTAGKPALRLGLCRDRLCPRCQAGRGVAATASIARHVAAYNAPRLLTLTLKHRPEPLAAMLDRLAAAFRDLRRRREWKAHVTRGIYAIEVTRNAKTMRWHAHVHVIADGAYFPQKSLSKLWLDVTGDSPICDVRAVHDRTKAAAYVAAYISKPADARSWSTNALLEFADAMHGRRLLHTFGKSHAAAVTDAEPKEPTKLAEPLGSLDRLCRHAARGHEPAVHALEIARRLGPMWRAASGLERLLWHEPTVPVEDWECQILIATMRSIALLDSGGQADTTRAPTAPPPAPTHNATSLLWQPTYI